jgi:hypothetical protein
LKRHSPRICYPAARSPRWSEEPNKQSSTKTLGGSVRPRRDHPNLANKIHGQRSAEEFPFLEARNDVPLKTEFKPAVKVLSRKPAPKLVARNDPVSGLEQLTVEDDEEESEGDVKKNMLSLEERKQKAQREREEKQRKYGEVRERLFGASGTGSGTSSPGNVTPPKGGEPKSRTKNKGGRDSRPSSSAGSKSRQLYDPSYTVARLSLHSEKRDTAAKSGSVNGERGTAGACT